MTDTEIPEEPTYQVFISYTRQDHDFAASLYDWLANAGFDAWMDTKKLKPGQNWDFEIDIALRKASFIVIILSNSSVDRRGYVQRELKLALDKYKEKLIDDIFIIPVLIEPNVKVPHELQSIQYISAQQPGFESAIGDALNFQIEKIGGTRKQVQKDKDIFWSFIKKREDWDGLPGYEYEVSLINFSSERYPKIQEISDVIKAHFHEAIFRLRQNKINQSTEYHSFTENKWSRTDTYNASCGEPIIKNTVICINYLIDWYGAGAAHPNNSFSTFCFVLDPLFRIENLKNIFVNESEAFARIRDIAIQNIVSEYAEASDDSLDVEWVEQGIDDWESVSNFVFTENGIEILFPPYRIGPYSAGIFSTVIPYEEIVDLIIKDFKAALGIEYLRRN